MRNYSLQSYGEDPNHKLHEARMMYSSRKLCAVFVEAQPDFKFFNKFVDDTIANLYFAKNRNQVLKYLDYSKKHGLNYFFGIIDADHEVLNVEETDAQLAKVAIDPNASSSQSFSDLESLMSASDAYLFAFVSAITVENLPPEKTPKNYAREIREKVRDEAAYLGSIHFAAQQLNPAPPVSPTMKNLRKFWNPNKNAINRTKILEEIAANLNPEEKIQFETSVRGLYETHGHSWRLCRGHIISMLTNFFILKTNGKEYKDWKSFLTSRNGDTLKDPFRFESLLGASFDKTMMASSVLGQQLMKFQNKKGKQLFPLS